jgi:hypothetical protein
LELVSALTSSRAGNQPELQPTRGTIDFAVSLPSLININMPFTILFR